MKKEKYTFKKNYLKTLIKILNFNVPDISAPNVQFTCWMQDMMKSTSYQQSNSITIK